MEFKVTTYDDEKANAWIPKQNLGDVHKDRIYKLFVMPDQGDDEIWIVDDKYYASMAYMWAKGDFVILPNVKVQRFEEHEFFSLAKEEKARLWID